MDKTDIEIIQKLRQNSRMPYRELAQSMNLSVNAVHKRIKDIVDTGIISEFYTNLKYDESELVGAVVMGRSQTTDIEDTLEKLSKNDSIAQVVVAGGYYLYIVGILHDINELDRFSRFVRKEAMLVDPLVGIGIDDCEDGPKEKLTSLDYQIAYALRSNSRKEVSEIADELGVATKTIHRRLSKLIEKKQISFGMDLDWAASNDIITIFHMNLKESMNRDDAMAVLANKYRPNFLQATKFSNIPDMFLATVWTKSMKELKEMQKKLQKEGHYRTIIPNISYSVQNYDTWSLKWLKEKAYPNTSK